MHDAVIKSRLSLLFYICLSGFNFWWRTVSVNRTCSLRSIPDDTPVASAKAAPADGLGDGDDEGNANGRLWRTVLIGEQEHRIDMQIIRPYLRVITHGGRSATGTTIRKRGGFVSAVIWTLLCNLVPSGYYGEGLNAIIVFSACYLPDSSCSDYHYIMENLFLWVCRGWLHSLERALANVSLLQLRGQQPGDAGGWRLPDHLHERSHSSQ